jgi:hypothetical protein
MILVARPTHGSIKERHTRHERRYSPAVRSSIGYTQEIECWVRRRAALVGCGGASAARRREEARACRAPFVVHPGPRECRRLSHAWKSHRRDRTGWLGRQDSNLGMAESKSTCSAFDFNDHPEKSANFDSFPSNRLGADSECAARRAQAFWCFLITLAFAVIMFLTAWHGPDCRSPQRSISIGGLMAGWGARQEREHGTTHRRAPRQVALHAGGLVRRGTRCLLGLKNEPADRAADAAGAPTPQFASGLGVCGVGIPLTVRGGAAAT